MISHSEGTDRAEDPYRCCYGYKHTIVSFADHPAVTGEWKGEPLSNLGPEYAHLISTAAGRYQINRPWWERAKRALLLPDFSPDSQDKAAIWLIKESVALGLVEDGHITDAIARTRETWASLPGGSSGQPEHHLEDLLAFYRVSGGTIGAEA
jgi:lysozyme